MRFGDNYFVIGTFSVQVVLWSVFNNWIALTGGPLGIPGIPPPGILGWSLDTPLGFMVLSLAMAAGAHVLVRRVTTSPYGRILHAIRDSERHAQSLGKNTRSAKRLAFAVNGAVASLAGSLYAHYMTYIDPAAFTMQESILFVAMIVLGGAGSRWGPIVGAVVLVGLPEFLRIVGLPSAVAANLRQILYGLALLACMAWRPQGLLGELTFERREDRE
jgi:branched-chain amino acid transport system permease protein